MQRDDWDSHWTQYAAAATLNPAQQMRHRLVSRLLSLPGDGQGLRLCDIGSGQGDLIASVQRAHPAVKCVGLELSAEGVAISKKKVPGAVFHVCDLFRDSADALSLRAWATHGVCSEVLEHVDDPVDFLRRARPFLAPLCRLVVTVPGGPMSQFDKHIGHRQHFDRQKIRSVLEGAGYRVERTLLSGFPMFNLYRLVVILRGKRLVKDVDGRSAASSRRAAGMAMGVFRGLFRLNLNNSPLGWQVVAVATAPQA